MDEVSLRETRDLLKQVREELLLRPSGLRPVHLIHCRRSESCSDTAAVQSGKENHVLDGDRSMADGRDILESELQKLVRKVWNDARKYGEALYYARVDKEVFLSGYDFDIHKLLISYLDSPTGDVGTQDETPEARAVGNSVRSKGRLIGRDKNAVIFDEADLCKKIRDEFTMDMAKEFAKYDKVPMVRYEEDKKPDGSISVRYIFAPFGDQQNPR